MQDEFLSDIRIARPRWIIKLSGYEDIYPEAASILEADHRMLFSEDNVFFSAETIVNKDRIPAARSDNAYKNPDPDLLTFFLRRPVSASGYL